MKDLEVWGVESSPALDLVKLESVNLEFPPNYLPKADHEIQVSCPVSLPRRPEVSIPKVSPLSASSPSCSRVWIFLRVECDVLGAARHGAKLAMHRSAFYITSRCPE